MHLPIRSLNKINIMVNYRKWDKLVAEINDSSDEEQLHKGLLEPKEGERCELYSLCNDSYSGKISN
jgi:hypothetical protein